MKNLYNITKGQLITIWIFGVIATLLSGAYAADTESAIGGILSILVPFIVIFYTIGWRERHREEWTSMKFTKYLWPRKH